MVERRVCTFCGSEIEPGTGRMYVKKDGVVYNFCSSKCYKNMVLLGRVPRRTTWTRYFEREKEIRMKGGPEAVEKPRARKLRKAEAAPEAEEKAPPEEGAVKAKEEKAAEEPERKKPEPPKEKKAPAKKSEKPAKPPAKKEKPKEAEKE